MLKKMTSQNAPESTISQLQEVKRPPKSTRYSILKGFSTPMKKPLSRENGFFVAQPEPDNRDLAVGGQMPFAWVHRQTPIRVHPRGAQYPASDKRRPNQSLGLTLQGAMSKNGLRPDGMLFSVRCLVFPNLKNILQQLVGGGHNRFLIP